MFYTYILESLLRPGQRYIGHTSDLRRRLTEHNSGKCPHTSKVVPWKLRLYVAFENLEHARRFEHYLKSASLRVQPLEICVKLSSVSIG